MLTIQASLTLTPEQAAPFILQCYKIAQQNTIEMLRSLPLDWLEYLAAEFDAKPSHDGIEISSVLKIWIREKTA